MKIRKNCSRCVRDVTLISSRETWSSGTTRKHQVEPLGNRFVRRVCYNVGGYTSIWCDQGIFIATITRTLHLCNVLRNCVVWILRWASPFWWCNSGRLGCSSLRADERRSFTKRVEIYRELWTRKQCLTSRCVIHFQVSFRKCRSVDRVIVYSSQQREICISSGGGNSFAFFAGSRRISTEVLI